MKVVNIIISLLIMIIFFVGCGVSDSSKQEQNSTEERITSIETEIEENRSEESAESDEVIADTSLPIVGYLIDSPIAGVEYLCGTASGVTTATGEFSCLEMPVTFFIGGLTLGTIDVVPEDSSIYPQDLVGVSRNNFDDTRLVRLTRFLQSLDEDGDIEEAITIPEGVSERLGEDANDATLEELAEMVGVDLVSEEEAMAHLRHSMETREPVSSSEEEEEEDNRSSDSTTGLGETSSSGDTSSTGGTTPPPSTDHEPEESNTTGHLATTIDEVINGISSYLFTQANGRNLMLYSNITLDLFENSMGLPLSEIIKPFSIVDYEENNQTYPLQMRFSVNQVTLHESNNTWQSSDLSYQNGESIVALAYGGYTVDINHSIILTQEGASVASTALKVVEEFNATQIQSLFGDMGLGVSVVSIDKAQLILKKVLTDQVEWSSFAQRADVSVVGRDYYISLDEFITYHSTTNWFMNKDNTHGIAFASGSAGTLSGTLIEIDRDGHTLTEDAGHWEITTIDGVEALLIEPTLDGYMALIFKCTGSRIYQGNYEERVGDSSAFLVFNSELGDRFKSYFISFVPESNCTFEGRALTKEFSSDTDREDYLGSAVAIYGDMVVAAAPRTNSHAGDVFVYRPDDLAGSTWSAYRLPHSGASGSASFGWDVDISDMSRIGSDWYHSSNNDIYLPDIERNDNRRIAVGEPSRDYGVRDSGMVHIYEHNESNDSWSYSEVEPNVITEYANFGKSVALDHSRMIVGSPGNHTDINNEHAYIFEHNGTAWVQVAQLDVNGSYNNPTYGTPYFGSAVDIKGNYAVVGASDTNDQGGFDAGMAYLYRYDGIGWELHHLIMEQNLSLTATRTVAYLGHAVKIGNEIVAVSALSKSHLSGQQYEGIVFIYDLESGALRQTLTPLDETENKEFGYSIDINANTIIVGARKDGTNQTGAAYIFDLNISTGLWEQREKLVGESEGDRFGSAVGITCGRAVIGSPLADDAQLDQGAIHIYD